MMHVNTHKTYTRSSWEGDLELLSKEVLPEATIPIVQALLAETQRDIATVDSEIIRIQSIQDDLTTKRAALCAKAERLSVALAPHKRIPPELLSRIFLHCLGEDQIYLPLNLNTVPWTITRVCSVWREIALAEPRLWRDISLKIENGKGLETANKAREILSRSGNCPISLSVVDLNQYYHDHVMSQLIMPYSTRIRKMSLTNIARSLDKFRRLPANTFTMLESVAFCLNSSPRAKAQPEIVAFSQSNSLRTLHLRQRISSSPNIPAPLENYGFRFSSFPWGQLTVISISEILISASMALSILHEASNVLNFLVMLGPGSTSGIKKNWPTPFVVPHLTSVQFTVHLVGQTFHQMLECITLPSLQIFIANSTHIQSWPHHQILSLLRRSTCPLENLTVANFTIATDSFETLMKEMPSLESLDVRHTGLIIPASILGSITQGTLLPKLEDLNAVVDSLSAVLDLLEERNGDSVGQRPEIKLIAIRVISNGDLVDDLEEERLQALEAKFDDENKFIEIRID